MKNLGIKTSLKLIVSYFAIAVLGTLCGACLYMVYSLCTMLVAGEALKEFSLDFFIRGAFVSFPICIICSCMLLVLSLIRHPASPFFPILTYICLAVASWLVLIPLCNTLSVKYDAHNDSTVKEHVVSAGLFRHDGNDVVFYTHINADKTADGVRITQKDDNGDITPFSNMSVVKTNSQFSDSRIEETVAMPKLFSFLLKGQKILTMVANASQKAGYNYWLCFATMGLALLSVSGLRRVSSWRLLNTFVVIITTASILTFNALYYGTGIFGHVPIVVDGWFRTTTFIQNPFMVICNVVVSLVFTAWGLCLDLFKKNPDLDEEGNPV